MTHLHRGIQIYNLDGLKYSILVVLFNIYIMKIYKSVKNIHIFPFATFQHIYLCKTIKHENFIHKIFILLEIDNHIKTPII